MISGTRRRLILTTEITAGSSVGVPDRGGTHIDRPADVLVGLKRMTHSAMCPMCCGCRPTGLRRCFALD
jgi:hypothetical protein